MSVPGQPTPLPRQPLRALARASLGLAGLLALSGLGMAGLAVQGDPATPVAAAVSAGDIDRAVRLLQLHDPRGKLPGISRQLNLVDRDLSLAAHVASRRLGEARSAVHLHAGWARLQASLPLRAGPVSGWLNLDVRLVQAAGLPAVEQVRLGHLALPGWLVERALPALLAATGLAPPAALVGRIVSQVRFTPGALSIDYAWPDDLQRTLASGLMPAEEQARVAVYTRLLQDLTAEWSAAAGAGTSHAAPSAKAASAPRALSMAQLLPPVFALARQRSADSAAAVLENRAALTALALMVNTAPLPSRRAVPGADGGYSVTLMGRQDTPLHFLISAALSAEHGSSLADAVGLYKELSDSRGGTGFSFNDLAADRAGTRLGQLAVRDPLGLQQRLAAGVQEDELMPMVADLPESLTHGEFQRRFGGVGGNAYRQLLRDIEARLDRLALHAPAGPAPGP